jgi:hypothetical protein
VRQKEELMKIGYVRVSKQEQHEALQIGALKEAGCEKWFLDKMTGSKAERKGRLKFVFTNIYPLNGNGSWHAFSGQFSSLDINIPAKHLNPLCNCLC